MKLLKKILSLILCPIMVLPFFACGQSDPQPSTEAAPTIDPNAPLCDGKTLKMLCITSSFLLMVSVAQDASHDRLGREKSRHCAGAQRNRCQRCRQVLPHSKRQGNHKRKVILSHERQRRSGSEDVIWQ